MGKRDGWSIEKSLKSKFGDFFKVKKVVCLLKKRSKFVKLVLIIIKKIIKAFQHLPNCSVILTTNSLRGRNCESVRDRRDPSDS